MGKLFKLMGLIIILLILATVLQATNPTEEQFVDWAYSRSKENADTELEKILGTVVGKPVLMMATTRDDYYVYSIFTVDKAEKEAKFVGIFNNIFFKIK
ncbi:MAG: hypothetical protein ACOCRZ_01965 [Halothermotrichaceae bacterium]